MEARQNFVSHLQWVLRTELQFSRICSSLLSHLCQPPGALQNQLTEIWFSDDSLKLLLCQGELESDLCICLEVK